MLATLLKKAPTQMLFREVCEIFKNIVFHRTLPVAASAPLMAASVCF